MGPNIAAGLAKIKLDWGKMQMKKEGKTHQRNGILLPKLLWPTVRKSCSSDWEFTKGQGRGIG